MRRALRSQAGFSMVEVLVVIMLVGIAFVAILGAFDAATLTAIGAQRHEQAIAIGQREVERLRTLDYATQLGMTATPVHADVPSSDTSPGNPNFYVTASGLSIKENYGVRSSATLATEAFATTSADSQLTSPQVDPGPTPFDDQGTTGTIYRYVTFRDEHCAVADIQGFPVADPCPGNQDTKRVTVAVVLDAAGDRAGPSKPIWVSSVVSNRNATPVGVSAPPTANPGSGPAVTAQPFFLYDTPCSSSLRLTNSSHPTHDTSRTIIPGVSPACGTVSADLMSNDAPPDDSSPPLNDYSNEISRPAPTGLSGPAGLVLQRSTTSGCRSDYATTDASTMKSQVHSWATLAFSSAFITPATGGRAAFSFWTQTVDGVAGHETLCITLRDAATGLAVSSTTLDVPEWPTEPTPLTRAWDLATPITIPATDRLMVTVSLESTSDRDIVLFYDHPDYASFLSIATTTPL
jgi:prepilin-type N-terminal cleavage/methylation domain-containing protein